MEKLLVRSSVREQAEGYLRAGASAHPTIVPLLESAQPGITAVLDAEWPGRHQAAVHAFEIPDLGADSASELLHDIERRVGRTLPVGPTHVFSPNCDAVGNHVLSLRVLPDSVLECTVDVVKEETLQRATRFEHTYKTTRHVHLRCHLSQPAHLTEAYAGVDDASRAMDGLLHFVFGCKPRTQPREHRIHRFKDHHVRMCASRLGMKQCRAEVMKDPRGLGGRIVYSGPEGADGDAEEFLAGDELAELLMKAENGERLYRFSFAHPDGWTEIGRVAFDVRSAASSGLLFSQKTSMSAKAWVLLDLAGRQE